MPENVERKTRRRAPAQTAEAPPPMLKDQLLTRVETAKLLRISPQSLANWVSIGRVGLPYIRLGPGRGGRVVYRLSDVERFILANLHGAPAGAVDANEKGN